MVEDLQVEANRLHRLFEKFSQESRAVSIATVALVVSLLCLLMAYQAMQASNAAKAKVDYELAQALLRIEQYEDAAEVTNIYLQRVHVLIETHGLEAPPLPETDDEQ